MLEATACFAAGINYVAPYWLTICGHSGIGKTYLAEAVRQQFLDQNRFEKPTPYPMEALERNRIVGNTEWFCEWRKFSDNIRSGGYERLVEDAIDEWFLIIDDFGAERDPTGFVAAASDRILNGRRGKWTLITTNLSLKDIGERMDIRIASRLIRGANKVIEVEAQDYALKP